MTLSISRAQTTIYSQSTVAKFPPVPRPKGDSSIQVDGDELLKGLTAILFACATDESRPALTAVCIDLGESPIVVAADGFRLMWGPLKVWLPAIAEDQARILIPRATVGALEDVWKRTKKMPVASSTNIGDLARNPFIHVASLAVGKRMMDLRYGHGQFRARFSGVTFVSQLVNGSYPNYENLIPQEWTGAVTVGSELLLKAAIRVGKMAENGIVRLRWDDGYMKVSAVGEEAGLLETDIPVKIDEEHGRIAIHHKYLQDYLKPRVGPVTMRYISPGSSSVFEGTDPYRLLQMPMFVKWGDEPLEEPSQESEERHPDGEHDPQQASTEEEPDGRADSHENCTGPQEEKGKPKRRLRKPPIPQSKKRRSVARWLEIMRRNTIDCEVAY